MAPFELVLGTRNRKKRGELEALLGLPGLTLTTIADYPDAPEVEEDGETFQANAEKKATTLARALGRFVLGEDSGLSVDALDGRPGIYSARFAGEPTNDERNNDKLLAELSGIPTEKRTAYYTCSAALSNPAGKVLATAEGHCHGVILPERRGVGGFGYDPLFLVVDTGQTFGELPPEFKNRNSHRAQAMALLRSRIMEVAHGTKTLATVRP